MIFMNQTFHPFSGLSTKITFSLLDGLLLKRATINYGESRKTRCQIDIDVTDWKKVKFYETSKIAPFLVAVTDIECYSSHGDFPPKEKL